MVHWEKERLLPSVLYPLGALRVLRLAHLRGLNLFATRTIVRHVAQLRELDVSGTTIASDACDALSGLRSLETQEVEQLFLAAVWE